MQGQNYGTTNGSSSDPLWESASINAFKNHNVPAKIFTESPKQITNFTAGFILILCLAAFTIQSELSQHLQQKYYKPYFILWIAHSLFSVVLPCQLIFNWISNRKTPSTSLREISTMAASLKHQSSVDSSLNSFNSVQLFPKPLLKISMSLLLLLTLPAYSWYVCVTALSLGDLTAIFNTSSFFAYLLSVLLLKESLRMDKILAVLVSIGGVIIISYFGNTKESTDKTSGAGTIAGYTLAFASALGYAFYEVAYKKWAVPSTGPSIVFANYLTGLIGLLYIIIGWIPIPILHYLQWEEFSLPDSSTLFSILLMSIFGVLYNGLFMVLVAYTGPVFAAVGIMLTIPIVTITDASVSGNTIGQSSLLGTFAIICGFALLVFANYAEDKEFNIDSPKTGKETDPVLTKPSPPSVNEGSSKPKERRRLPTGET